MNQIQYFLLMSKPIGRRIRFMLVEGIVRKTLGLKKHRVKKVSEDDGCLAGWLLSDGRFKPVCSCCDAKE